MCADKAGHAHKDRGGARLHGDPPEAYGALRVLLGEAHPHQLRPKRAPSAA